MIDPTALGEEPDDAGADHAVDPDLLELFEVIEYQKALAEEGHVEGDE